MWISNWIGRTAWGPLVDPEGLEDEGIDLERSNSEQIAQSATTTKELVSLFFKSFYTPIEQLPGYVAPDGLPVAPQPEEPPAQEPSLLGKMLVNQLEGVIPAIKNLVKTKVIPALGDKPDLSDLLSENRRLQRQIQQQTLPIDPPKAIPADRIKAIKEQFTKLKELSVQMALTRLIFGTEDLAETFHEIVTLKENIASTNLDHGPDQIFETALTRKFYASKRSIRDQLYFSFCLFIARPLKFHIEHALDQIQADLLSFIEKDCDERMHHLLPLIIKPLKSHLTAFQSYLETLNKSDKLPKSIDAIVEEDFKISRTKSNRLTNDLASVFVRKYIPSLSFTGDYLSQHASYLENTRFKEYIPSIKVALQTCLSPLGIIVWVVNKIYHTFIQLLIAKIALPRLFQSTQTALSSQSTYQHTLNQFVLKKLHNFNEAAKKPKQFILQKRSLSYQKEFEGLISLFYTAIPLEQAMTNISTLHQFFNPGLLPALKQDFEAFCAQQIAPTVATEILTLLEESLQQEELSGFVWEALDNLKNNLQNPPKPPSKEEKKRTEALVLDTLKSAATLAVEDTVKTFLDSSEKLNHQTKTGIEKLQTFALELAKSCENINSDTFPLLKQQWEALSDIVTSLGNQLDQTNIRSLLMLSNTIAKSFKEATAQFKEHIKTPQQLQTDKNTLETKKENLTNRAHYFLNDVSISDPAQILNSLKTLKNQLGSRFEDQNLILATDTFIYITENYLKIKPNAQSVRIFEQNFDNFKTALEKAIAYFDILIANKSQEINNNTNGVKQEAAALKTWAEALKTVLVTPEEVKSPVFQLLTPDATLKLQDAIAGKMMEHGSAALGMKDKPYHYEQLLWRFAEAYLKV